MRHRQQAKTTAHAGHDGAFHALFRRMEPEQLLRDLIALPSVNPAFVPEGDERAGEWRVADFLASLAAQAGLPVEFQEVFPVKGSMRARSNLIVRLGTDAPAKRRIILAPHLDT